MPAPLLLPTTVVGSYVLPPWLYAAKELIQAGRFGKRDIQETLEDATVSIINRRAQETQPGKPGSQTSGVATRWLQPPSQYQPGALAPGESFAGGFYGTRDTAYGSGHHSGQ